MRSWHHNIEKVMNDNGCFLICGDSVEHNVFTRTKWCIYIDGSGKILSVIEPVDVQFVQSTILDKCISEIIVKNRIKYVVSKESEVGEVWITEVHEDGSYKFYRET
jgi:hypothetical protein